MSWNRPWGHGYGYGYGHCAPVVGNQNNNGFILLVVLFILLVIVGSNYPIGEECPPGTVPVN
jgi:uncharacterized protein (TIGR01732 family)